MTIAPCRILDWDTNFWGFPVATITSGNRLDEALAAIIEAWCLRNHVRCLYFSADGTCPTTLATAAKHGFQFVDLRQNLSLDLRSATCPGHGADPPTVAVRAARHEDLPETRWLAGVCHEDTRFFKDAAFPRAKAADMFRCWIDADFSREGLLIASLGNGGDAPIGYVSYSLPTAARGRIGLIGVGEEHRGRGVAAALLDAVVATIRARGCEALDVATQGTNVGALRLYCRRGFLPASSSVWFHRWW